MRYLPEGISTWEEYEEEEQKFIDILMDHIEIEDVRSEREIETQDIGTGREFCRNYMEQDHRMVTSYLYGTNGVDHAVNVEAGPKEALWISDRDDALRSLKLIQIFSRYFHQLRSYLWKRM